MREQIYSLSPLTTRPSALLEVFDIKNREIHPINTIKNHNAVNTIAFSGDGKKLKNYTTADGLVNNSVVSVLEDQAGNLWFGTKGFGLSRYDGKTFRTFSQYDN